jgi:hypothetical protein
MGRIPDDLYALLAHGDEGHRKWLRDTIESFWAARKPVHMSPADLKGVIEEASEFSLSLEHVTKPPQALRFARAAIALNTLLQSAVQERDRERTERDKYREAALEEKKRREVLQEEAEELERLLRQQLGL